MVSQDEGYPFKVTVELTYRLISCPGKPSHMECETTARPSVLAFLIVLISLPIVFTIAHQAYNEGEEAAPFGAGWHPYFRMPSRKIDGLQLTMGAGTAYVVDEQVTPERWMVDQGCRRANLGHEPHR